MRHGVDLHRANCRVIPRPAPDWNECFDRPWLCRASATDHLANMREFSRPPLHGSNAHGKKLASRFLAMRPRDVPLEYQYILRDKSMEIFAAGMACRIRDFSECRGNIGPIRCLPATFLRLTRVMHL